MAEIDAQAMFHRTLGRPPRTASDYVRHVYGTAYTFRGRELVVTTYVDTGEQRDFRKYATKWELEHSMVLAVGRGANPVVDAQKMVIGHRGTFGSDGEYPDTIFVPKNTKRMGMGLQELVDRGVPVLAHLHIKHARVYNPFTRKDDVHAKTILDRLGLKPFDLPQHSYELVTDIEGRVVHVLSGRSKDGVESHWMSPIDLVMVPKLVGGIVIKTLFRKSFRDAAVRGTAEELGTQIANRVAANRTGKVAVEEMERILTEVLAQRPELRRLMAAQVMTGEGRMQAIKIAWQEWERTQGWKVVQKTAKEMEAVTHPQNLMTLRAQTRELWINKDRAARWDPDVLYRETAHEFSAHALTGRGGSFTGSDLAFIGHEFSRTNNALFILENAITLPGGLQRVLQTYR